MVYPDLDPRQDRALGRIQFVGLLVTIGGTITARVPTATPTATRSTSVKASTDTSSPTATIATTTAARSATRRSLTKDRARIVELKVARIVDPVDPVVEVELCQ